MKNLLSLIFIFVFLASCGTLSRKQDTNTYPTDAQDESIIKSSQLDTPKLVVGIVVDQMRYDYLSRFYSRYGTGGFKRLMNDGYNLTNNHYNFVPTYTAPGHASIYTGTSPMNHGIIGNNWYDKFEGSVIYNASDVDYNSVGTTSDEGKMSPRRMLTTTVTDQLELHTQGRAKVIGISIKDRGAILPAGHAADAEVLRAWCRDQLAAYKVPGRFVFAPIPRTSTGKIQKFALRAQVMQTEPQITA